MVCYPCLVEKFAPDIPFVWSAWIEVAPAVTIVDGTALCLKHALHKEEEADAGSTGTA